MNSSVEDVVDVFSGMFLYENSDRIENIGMKKGEFLICAKSSDFKKVAKNEVDARRIPEYEKQD